MTDGNARSLCAGGCCCSGGSLMLQGMTWKGSPFEALSGLSALATTGGYRGAHCCCYCCCPLGWKLRAVTYFPLDHQHYVGPD